VAERADVAARAMAAEARAVAVRAEVAARAEVAVTEGYVAVASVAVCKGEGCVREGGEQGHVRDRQTRAYLRVLARTTRSRTPLQQEELHAIVHWASKKQAAHLVEPHCCLASRADALLRFRTTAPAALGFCRRSGKLS